MHLGSQLRDTDSARASVDWAAEFSASCRAELDWTPRVLDVGGGLGIRYRADDSVPGIAEFVGVVRDRVAERWAAAGLPEPELIVEPGRSVVGPAGVTLYRVGVVKQASESTTYVAIDGGMSDNPRPQLYDAEPTVAVAGRFDAEPDGLYTVAGKHCESGDVLASGVPLPEPTARRRPGSPGDGRVHARDGVAVQRSPAPGRGAGGGRRSERDPPPRDGRRPAGARA